MSQIPRLTEADVITYLEDHSDFFIGKDELLSGMRIPHNSGPATSLVERQLAVHRERNVELRQRLSDLLENARRNDQLFAKSRRLVLSLVEASTWFDVQAALDDSLRKDFSVDAWAMLHFTERQLEPPLIAIHSSETQRTVHRLFKGHRAICGQLPENDIAQLLGLEESTCRSAAAAHIRGKDNLGILTVASENPNFYRSSMDTLFLDYIADILALRLPQIPVN